MVASVHFLVPLTWFHGCLPPALEETVVKKTGSDDEKAASFFLFEKTR